MMLWVTKLNSTLIRDTEIFRSFAVFGFPVHAPIGDGIADALGFFSGLNSGGVVAALLTHRLIAGIPLGWHGWDEQGGWLPRMRRH